MLNLPQLANNRRSAVFLCNRYSEETRSHTDNEFPFSKKSSPKKLQCTHQTGNPGIFKAQYKLTFFLENQPQSTGPHFNPKTLLHTE